MSTRITLHHHHRWPRCLVLAIIPAFGTACDAQFRVGGIDDDAMTERSNPGGPGGGGIWINNGLSEPSVVGVHPAYPLSSPLGLSEVEGVLTNEDTHIAARYLVECALPLEASIVKTVDGEQLVLEGHLGLAPEWEDGACDGDCQQWISACMLARTNVNSQSLPIALRADHPAIGFDGPNNTVYEASYFGNLFAAPAGKYMCEGSEAAVDTAHLSGRTCSSDPEGCDFEGYDDCEEEDRCEFVAEDGGVTAVDCVPAGSNTEYHTISVYIAENGGGNGNGNGGGNGGGNGNGNGGGNGNGNGGGNGNGN